MGSVVMNEWKMSQFFPSPVYQWDNVLLSQAREWGPVGLFVYAAPEEMRCDLDEQCTVTLDPRVSRGRAEETLESF